MQTKSKIKRFLNSQGMQGIVPTEKQLEQIHKVYTYFDQYGEREIKRQSAIKKLPEMIRCGVDNAYVQRLKRSVREGTTQSLKKFTIMYGKECAYEKWKRYCDRQRITNTCDYKKRVHDMTDDQVDAYNQSRSQTKENMIARYGAEEGARRWDAYCRRQQYAGTSLEYFIDKYGPEDGPLKYQAICDSKAQTVDNIMRVHGVDEDTAAQILSDRYARTPIGVSKVSQDFCWALYRLLTAEDREQCYFHELNREFGKFDDVHRRYTRYDFTLAHKGIMIEFQGDYYHANPRKYRPDDVVNIHGTPYSATQLWEKDQWKAEVAARCGFKVIHVWESDWVQSKDKILERCLNEINGTS